MLPGFYKCSLNCSQMFYEEIIRPGKTWVCRVGLSLCLCLVYSKVMSRCAWCTTLSLWPVDSDCTVCMVHHIITDWSHDGSPYLPQTSGPQHYQWSSLFLSHLNNGLSWFTITLTETEKGELLRNVMSNTGFCGWTKCDTFYTYCSKVIDYIITQKSSGWWCVVNWLLLLYNCAYMIWGFYCGILWLAGSDSHHWPYTSWPLTD